MTDYVGVPFTDGGRDRAGVDCYGLVRLYLREELGIALALHSETSAHDVAGAEAAIAGGLATNAWRLVPRSELRRGDVVLMWGFERIGGEIKKTLRHMGVMLDARRMLHVEAGIDSAIARIGDATVRHRIESCWRYQGVADAVDRGPAAGA